MTFPQSNAVMPIFLTDNFNENVEQIGSGVLIEIGEEIYLLTAAHVTDWRDKGILCIPGKSGIKPIAGHVVSLEMPTKIDRQNDKVDISYFRLSHDLAQDLHDEAKPIVREDMNLTESLIEGDLYTFAGYPLTKTKVKTDVVSSEPFFFTGEASSAQKYSTLGYDIHRNIVINFNRKKVKYYDGSQFTAPHPRGVSGGGIFSWPKDFSVRPRMPERLLVGIGHTYHERHHCLVGTRINVYLSLIQRNHPSLFEEVIERQMVETVPAYMGIVWYKREEWDLLMSQFEDAASMHKTWSEWRQAAENGLEQMLRQGTIMIPMEISSKEIMDFCRSNGLPNIGRTRIRLCNQKLYEMIKERNI
jgi:hypothetical protein